MTWKNPPSNFTRTVTADTEKKVKRVALRLLRELTFVSPIDTGRFRGNWVVGINSKNETSTEQVKQPQTVLSDAAVALRNFRAFGSVFISNNLPYAQKLNDGHSKQAPANFVQRAVAKVTK